MLLKGRKVLITGAARGIGRVIASVAAEQGADVAVADILPDVDATARKIAAPGRIAVPSVFDISDPDEVREGVERIREAIGEIDVLVNNAGIVNNIAPLTKMSHDA